METTDVKERDGEVHGRGVLIAVLRHRQSRAVLCPPQWTAPDRKQGKTLLEQLGFFLDQIIDGFEHFAEVMAHVLSGRLCITLDRGFGDSGVLFVQLRQMARMGEAEEPYAIELAFDILDHSPGSGHLGQG